MTCRYGCYSPPPGCCCLCGCGAEVRNWYRQGHDAKHLSQLLAALVPPAECDLTPALLERYTNWYNKRVAKRMP